MDKHARRARRVPVPSRADPAAPAERPLPINLGGHRQGLRRQRRRRHWLRAQTADEAPAGR